MYEDRVDSLIVDLVALQDLHKDRRVRAMLYPHESYSIRELHKDVTASVELLERVRYILLGIPCPLPVEETVAPVEKKAKK